MFNKYSNVLTMFLVVLIVAILGVVGYFAYDLLHSKSVNTNAQTALDEFEKATTGVRRDTSNLSNSKDGENTTTNTTNKLDELNELMNQNTTTEEPTTTEEEVEKVYMEGYEVKGRIQIPKTKVDYPVLEGVTKKSLEIAVGIAYGPGLNEVGNTTIFGHNYRNGLFFSNNKKLAIGDKIIITDQKGEEVTYVIYNMYQTDPNDASYMTRDTQGKREISLQTCTDDSSARIIIWAAEQ